MKRRALCETMTGTVGIYLAWVEWYERKPPEVQALIAQVPPNSWWRLKAEMRVRAVYVVHEYDQFFVAHRGSMSGLTMARYTGGGRAPTPLGDVQPGDLRPATAKLVRLLARKRTARLTSFRVVEVG